MCVCALSPPPPNTHSRMCASWACEIRGPFVGVSYLLPQCESWWSNSSQSLAAAVWLQQGAICVQVPEASRLPGASWTIQLNCSLGNGEQAHLFWMPSSIALWVQYWASGPFFSGWLCLQLCPTALLWRAGSATSASPWQKCADSRRWKRVLSN